MDITEIKARIDEFKAIKAKNSITPESLGTLLEDMFTVTEQLAEAVAPLTDLQTEVMGAFTTGTATLGTLYCSGQGAATILTESATGYYQMSEEAIQLKAGQHLHINAYQLPGILVFVDRYAEGYMTKGVWKSDNDYAIDYSAKEDVMVAIAMATTISTVESVEYNITQEALLERIMNLEQVVEDIPEPQDPFVILDVYVFQSKTQFIPNQAFTTVWNAMQTNTEVPVAVRVTYASRLQVLFIATCVKQNYISLNAKAGSCELKVNENGSFTITGTSLW